MMQGFRKGIIDRVGDKNKPEEAGRYRVSLEEDNIVTGWLDLIVRNSKDNHDDFSLDVGEPVAIYLEPDFRSGCIFGSLRTKKNPPKETDPDIEKKTFKDGSYVSYDRKNHIYSINLTGSNNKVNIKADNGDVNVECKTAVVKVSDEMKVDGKLHVTKDVTFDGKLDVTEDISSQAKVKAATGVESQADVKAGIISLLSHIHPTTSPGSPTGTPQ